MDSNMASEENNMAAVRCLSRIESRSFCSTTNTAFAAQQQHHHHQQQQIDRLPIPVVRSLAPASKPLTSTDVFQRMVDVVSRSRHLICITGAGISTESGIPDYRSPNRPPAKPMSYSSFVSGRNHRQRYWARSMIGYLTTAYAQPNHAHQVLAELEQRSVLRHIITQNVDSLHQKAGSSHVTELHGCLREVVCLGCGEISSRDQLQQRLVDGNPEFVRAVNRMLESEQHAASASHSVNSQSNSNSNSNSKSSFLNYRERILRPDGDVDLPAEIVEGFRVPDCLRCTKSQNNSNDKTNDSLDGVLKPNVVFFGETVPRQVVDLCHAQVDASDCVLVVGSSLQVWSGFRFVRRAVEQDVPVFVINVGPTRADALPGVVRLDALASTALDSLGQQLLR